MSDLIPHDHGDAASLWQWTRGRIFVLILLAGFGLWLAFALRPIGEFSTTTVPRTSRVFDIGTVLASNPGKFYFCLPRGSIQTASKIQRYSTGCECTQLTFLDITDNAGKDWCIMSLTFVSPAAPQIQHLEIPISLWNLQGDELAFVVRVTCINDVDSRFVEAKPLVPTADPFADSGEE